MIINYDERDYRAWQLYSGHGGYKEGSLYKIIHPVQFILDYYKVWTKQGNIQDSDYFIRSENQNYKYILKPQQKGHLNIGIQDVLFVTLARLVKEYGSDLSS